MLFQKSRAFFTVFKAYKRPNYLTFLPEIMANNTLNEWSDGDDDWVFEIDEQSILPNNTLNEWSDGDDDWVFEIDEQSILPNNTLNEWSDGDDDWVFEIDEQNILPNNTLNEWSDGDWVFEIDEQNNNEEDGELIRSINESEVLNQTGRGQKRKNDDQDEEPQHDYYEMKTARKHHLKKFDMTATTHTVRFNNGLKDVDLLESQQCTHAIFHHLLEDVTTGMNPNDRVRFVLRSDQLQTPISIPFLPVEKLSTKKVLSHVEKVVQSNEQFRLNDMVTVDIIHVEMPQGSGKSKLRRTTYDIREYLKKKKSIIPINNKDDLCLARALAVSIARIEKDPRYKQISNSCRFNVKEHLIYIRQRTYLWAHAV